MVKILWNTVIGTTVVAVLGFGSVGAMAVASSLTIDEEVGQVQPIAPVSVDPMRSTAPGGDLSVGAGPTPAADAPATDAPATNAPSIDAPVTNAPSTDRPTPAPSLVPTDPTSPVAVPPAGSRTISDNTIATNPGPGTTDDSGGSVSSPTETAKTSGNERNDTNGSSKPGTVDDSGSTGVDDD